MASGDVMSFAARATVFRLAFRSAETHPTSPKPLPEVRVPDVSPKPTTATAVSLAWDVGAVTAVVTLVLARGLLPVAVLSAQDSGAKLSNSYTCIAWYVVEVLCLTVIRSPPDNGAVIFAEATASLSPEDPALATATS